MPPPLLRDAQYTASRALPNGAATVVQAVGFDLENSSRGDFLARCELRISAPALTVGELANGATVTYDLIQSNNADLSSPVTMAAAVLVQTGAGGIGAAAAEARAGIPSNVRRYVGLRATNSGAGNQSAKSAILELLF